MVVVTLQISTNALLVLMTVARTQCAGTLKGVLSASVIQDILEMEETVKVQEDRVYT